MRSLARRRSLDGPRRRDGPLRRRLLALVLHVTAQRLLARPAAIDDAGRVDADALGAAGLGRGRRNEGSDFAVLRAADPDALREAGISLRVGLRIGDINDVVLVDDDVARAAELLPFGDELAG